MQIHEHVLLEGGLSVVDADRVVMAVQTVDKRLYGGLVEMTDVRGGLAWFVAHHEGLWVDQTESVNDDFSFDGLYGIDDNSDGAGCKLLERLLSVDIDRREPAAETRMRVVPAYDRLLTSRLPQHIHHLGLEDRVYSFNGDTSPGLRHRKHVYDAHCVIVDELSQHETHNFHRHTGAAVAQHLE